MWSWRAASVFGLWDRRARGAASPRSRRGLASSVEAFWQRVHASLETATFEQKRQLVALLIDRVIVTGDKVEIRYVIPTRERSEHIRFCHLRLDYFGTPDLIHP